MADTESMNLDIGTVLFSSLLIGVALVLFSWSLSLAPRAPRWRLDWAWGNTALFVGVGLYLTQGRISPWLSIVLANGLVILGYHLLENGLRRFASRPFSKVLAGFLAASFLLSFLLFTFVWDLYQVRVVVYTVFVIAVWARILFLLRKVPEYQRHPVLFRSFQGLCALILLSQAGRAFLALGEGANGLLGSNDVLALMLLVNLLAVTAWSMVFVTLDVTRGQTQLEAALETRDKMLQLIAHDLRGPLGGQVSLLELMQENGECRDEGDEMLAALVTSAQNSFDLLENLLDWGQSQKGTLELHPEDLGARDLLTEAAEPYTALAKTKNIPIEIVADPAAQIHSDRKTVTAILRNLISNAVKFTPPGGSIRLVFERRSGTAAFQVKDTGPGIRDPLLASLNAGISPPSTPGTDSEHGSGLGLALCRDFAQLNKGVLRFASSSQGTTATLELP